MFVASLMLLLGCNGGNGTGADSGAGGTAMGMGAHAGASGDTEQARGGSRAGNAGSNSGGGGAVSGTAAAGASAEGGAGTSEGSADAAAHAGGGQQAGISDGAAGADGSHLPGSGGANGGAGTGPEADAHHIGGSGGADAGASDAGAGADAADGGASSAGDAADGPKRYWKIPPTGQALCYDSAGAPMPCTAFPCNADGSPPLCGQDAQYPDNPRAFAESSQGSDAVVLDSLTGLIWQKTYESGMSAEQAGAYCDGLAYAGHTDWRLPDIHELASLVNYERAAPASDFPNMGLGGWFWSSTRHARSDTSAWGVEFGFGAVSSSATCDARCVRGARPSFGTLETRAGSGERTVANAAIGLLWQGCPAGISGDACEQGSIATYSWQEALQYCERLQWAEYEDWRLPNINELASLVNYVRSGPATDFPHMPETNASPGRHFWSSTSGGIVMTSRAVYPAAWVVDFHDGYTSRGDKSDPKAVLCVRAGDY